MQFSRKRTCAALVVGVSAMALLASASARADQATADRIKLGIDGWVKENIAAATGSAFHQKGEIQVLDTPAQDGSYAVLMPTYVLGDDEGSVTLEGIKATVRPQDADRYEVAWVLPDSVSGRGKKGKVFELVQSGQANYGVWDARLKTFRSMKARVEQSKLLDDKGVTVGVFGPLEMTVATTDSGKDRVDFAETVTLTGIKLFDSKEPSGAAVATIDRLTGQFDVKGVDIPGYLEMARRIQVVQEKIQAEVEKARTSAEAKKTDGKSPAKGRGADAPNPALVNELLDVLDGSLQMLDGGAGSFGASGISVRVPADKKTGEAAVGVSIEALSYNSQASGLRSGSVAASLGMALKGLTITPALPDQAFVPTDVAVQLGVSGLPRQALFTLVRQSVAAGHPGLSVGDALALSDVLALGLLDAVTKAQSGATIDRLEVKAPSYALTMRGDLKADASSPLKASGHLTVAVSGLDAVQKRAAADPAARQAVGVIAMAQAMGAQGQDGSRTYEFELTPQGKLMLNGADFGGAMGLPAEAGKPGAKKP